MTETGARKATRVAAALCLALGAVAAPAGAADVDVQVGTVDGKKFVGTLYAGEQAVPVESGKPKLKVRNLDTKKRIAIAVDLKVEDAKGKPSLRYVGVAEVIPGRGPVQVKATPVKDMNAFCAGCHPSATDKVQEGQIVRDLHRSGQEITSPYRAQAEKFKEFIEAKRKEGKERPPEPIVFEERIVIVDGKEVTKYFYTCESCHTIHWKTPWTKYARARFVDMGTLCAGCHY